MPDNADLKKSIQTALGNFEKQPLADAARGLLNTLGYRSNKTLKIAPNNAQQFQVQFDANGRMNQEAALLTDWRSVDLLIQVTDAEIRAAAQGALDMFASKQVDDKDIRSYLFFAVELKGAQYTRTQLAGITREINKLFHMPVMVIFRYDKVVSLAIIARRISKHDPNKDVLQKVTLIKDIRFTGNRAQIEILHDLSITQLMQAHEVSNFVDLQKAWEQTLDINELNKKFYKEIANWYFWAVKMVKFPKDAEKDEATRNATSIIRLITRLIFVWFIKEKGLIPEVLFDERKLKEMLEFTDPKKSTYYKAILQNLFFATLNTEMGADRMFRRENAKGQDPDYLMSNFYRYKRYFKNPDEALKLFAGIPFLNGGLFECLDKEIEKGNVIRIDGFSDREDNPLQVPDKLFLQEKEEDFDLNDIYDTTNKKYKVRGLIHIFNSYKFTIEENTPIEEEIALDPELLGKVFENLLAAYNPETGTTARKQTGSFYTPREIVNYMVDEALLAYLETALTPTPLPEGEGQRVREKLRSLLAYNNEPPQFTEAEKNQLITAIDNIKVLDPACGSGAFPMGVLHKLVFILGKLDPDNERWKQKQIDNTKASDSLVQEAQIKAIDEVFADNHNDYGRKLFLIENCIYGVDIQPIAVQIAKLRFFISLVVDQKTNPKKENLGIRPLPNLETKFVAANTLIGIKRPDRKPADEAPASISPEVEEACNLLIRKLEQYLQARNPDLRARYITEAQQIADVINAGMGSDFQPLGVDWIFTTAKDTTTLKNLLPVKREAKASKLVLRNQEIADKEQELEHVRREHFSARTPVTKRKYRGLDKRLRLEIADLLSKNHALEDETAQQLAGWDPYDQNTHADFFDPEWMFGVEGGFDVVIGNPPYIGEKGHKEIFDIVKTGNLREYYLGKMDYFYFFFHASLNFGRERSHIAFITTNYYLTAFGAKKLREDFKNRSVIKRLINFNELKLFENAMGQHNMITILLKYNDPDAVSQNSMTRNRGYYVSETLKNILNKKDTETEYYEVPQKNLYDGDECYIRFNGVLDLMSNNSVSKILAKITLNGSELGEICNVDAGLHPGVDRISGKILKKYPRLNLKLNEGVFILSASEAKRFSGKRYLKPLYKSSDIHRWSILPNNYYVLYNSPHNEIKDDLFLKHISKFKNILEGVRAINNENLNSWKYLRRGVLNETIYTNIPKIVAPYRSNTNRFAFTNKEFYASQDVYFITENSDKVSLKYVLSLLNSKLYFFWLYYRGKRKGNALELYQKPLSEIPIRVISQNEQLPYIKLVDQIYAINRDNPNALINDLEKEIDLLVYQLYELTKEEIDFVESKNEQAQNLD